MARATRRPDRPAELTPDQKIEQALPGLIDGLINLSRGTKILEPTADDPLATYKVPPNRQAAEYLINRVLGRPTEAVAKDGAGGPGYDEIETALKDLRSITLDDLIQLHRKTLGDHC